MASWGRMMLNASLNKSKSLEDEKAPYRSETKTYPGVKLKAACELQTKINPCVMDSCKAGIEINPSLKANEHKTETNPGIKASFETQSDHCMMASYESDTTDADHDVGSETETDPGVKDLDLLYEYESDFEKDPDNSDQDPDYVTESECSSVEYPLQGLDELYDEEAEPKPGPSTEIDQLSLNISSRNNAEAEGNPNSRTETDVDLTSIRITFKNITVPYAKKNERMYSKADYCKYCHKQYTSKISKHYQNCHHGEEKVKEILALPLRTKQRKNKSILLQNEGNHFHNMTVLKNGLGELVVSRRPTNKEEADASQYLPCTNCLGWFHNRNLPLHSKTCPAGIPQDNNHIRNARMLIAPLINSKKDEITELFSQMKETKKYPGLREISENDLLICQFAKGLLQKLGTIASTKEEQRLKDIDNIRTKVRHVARLLKAAKESDKEITDLESLITPRKFFFVVDTVKRLSVECDSPKLASTLGHYLKQLTLLKKSLSLVAEDDTKHKQAVDFDTLFDAHWNSYVSAVANRRLKLRTLNKEIKIPQTNDLVALKEFLDGELERHIKKFPLSRYEWTHMAMMLIVRITLFNKRRISEVAEMKVKDYVDRIGSSITEEILNQLDFTEKVLAKRMSLIEVRGKSTRSLRKVFIVLTEKMIQACDHLLKTKFHAGLNPENIFFFPRQNSLGPIDGCMAMREVTKLCDKVKEPDLIRSRLLRKYMATTIQILDMSRDELSTVADHMGHSVSVHTDIYRMQTSIQEKTKVARALIALENGQLSKFSGKPLSSITLDQLPLPVCDEDSDDENENETRVQSEEHHDNDRMSQDFVPLELDNDTVSSTGVVQCMPQNVRKATKRKRWDKHEEQILMEAFKQFFEQNKNPSIDAIVTAQKAFPTLQKRSVPVIKSKINNILLGKCRKVSN